MLASDSEMCVYDIIVKRDNLNYGITAIQSKQSHYQADILSVSLVDHEGTAYHQKHTVQLISEPSIEYTART